MELGEATLRRSGANFLLRAIHSRHGLVWSDGQNVFLSPVIKTDDRLLHSSPIKLGEFDGITSLSWSCDFAGGWCYLCVIQTQKVSIWRVDGAAPNLKLKLVRKISKTPLPQGCLWNPVRDILSISTKEQTSLYFRHTDKKSSLSLPLPNGTTIRCSCWSEKGDRIYISSYNKIWIYSWDDIDMKYKNFSTNQQTVNSDIGRIRCMISVGREYLLLTSEHPIEDLCKQSNIADQLDMNTALQSPTSTLLNLTSATQTHNSSSKLIMISFNGDNQQVISVENLTDILTPDLLCYHFDGTVQSVVVGSNSQSTLKYYNITSLGSFSHQHDVILPESDRPKGLIHVPHRSNSIYVLVGKTRNENSAFLNTSNDIKYELRLTIAQLLTNDIEKSPSVDDARQTLVDPPNLSKLLPKIPNSSLSIDEGSNTKDEGLVNKERSASVPILSIEEITPDNSSSSSILADTLGSNRNKRDSINDNTAVGSTNSLWSRNITQSETSLDRQIPQSSPKPLNTDNQVEVEGVNRSNDDELILNIERDIKRHDTMLTSLRERVENLTEYLEEINMISTCHYQQLNNPEFVYIEYYNTSPDQSTIPTHKQTFLTDRGRLKLETLLSVFNTTYLLVQLNTDCPPLVLTSNIDGYIPLRFEQGQTYHVFSETSSQTNLALQRNPSPQNVTSQDNSTPSTHDITLPSANSSLNGRTTRSPDPQKPPRENPSGSVKAERLDKLKQVLANDMTGEALYRLKTAAYIKKSSSSEQLENGTKTGRPVDTCIDVTYNL